MSKQECIHNVIQLLQLSGGIAMENPVLARVVMYD